MHILFREGFKEQKSAENSALEFRTFFYTLNFRKCANLRFYFHIYFEDWTSNSQHHIVIIRRVEEDQHYGASERPKPVCELDLAGAPLLPYLQLHCCQLAGAARHI